MGPGGHYIVQLQSLYILLGGGGQFFSFWQIWWQTLFLPPTSHPWPKRHPCQSPPMTNALSKAGKRLFAHDPDVRPYAAADTAYDDDEYVPEHTEDERADADRRKVSLNLYFFFPLQQHTHTLLPPLPPIHFPSPQPINLPPNSLPTPNTHIA